MARVEWVRPKERQITMSKRSIQGWMRSAGACALTLGLMITFGPGRAAAHTPENAIAGVDLSATAEGFDSKTTVSAMSILVDYVSKQVLAQYPNAYLVEIDTQNPNGPTKNPLTVTQWTLIFDDTVDGGTHHAIFATVNLPRLKVTLTVLEDLYIGSTPLHAPFPMGLLEADRLLKRAGYSDAYQSATYRQPNAGSPVPDPLWIFGPLQDGTFVAVDSVTRSVQPFD